MTLLTLALIYSLILDKIISCLKKLEGGEVFNDLIIWMSVSSFNSVTYTTEGSVGGKRQTGCVTPYQAEKAAKNPSHTT